MTTEQINREVAEWLGITLHVPHSRTTDERLCSCGQLFKHHSYLKYHIDFKNPDFSTDAGAVMLLIEIMKLKEGEVWLGKPINGEAIVHVHPMTGTQYVNFDYITTPGKLLRAVWEWSKKERANG